jgi:hypothetical protein
VVGSTKTDEDGAAAINSIAFSGRKCSDVYIGGNFSRVNGTKVSNIAEISARTGNVLRGFAHNANRTVDTLAKVGGHLLTGGKFTSINGARTAHMISLNSRNRSLTSSSATAAPSTWSKAYLAGSAASPGTRYSC